MSIRPPALSPAAAAGAYVPFAPHRPVARPKFTLLDDMTAGWSIGGSNKITTSTLADTTDPSPIAASSARIVTSGAATGFALLFKNLSAFDLTGKSLLVWVKIPTSMAHLNDLTLYVGDTTFTNYFTFTVINPLGSGTRVVHPDQWVPVTIPWAPVATTGTPNRASVQQLRFVFNDDLAGSAQEWRLGGVATIPEQSTLFPNGVVSLCFDDSNALDFVRKTLAAKGMPATLFPIMGTVDGLSGRPSLADLRLWVDNLGWEVGAHCAQAAEHVGLDTLTQAQRLAFMQETKQAHAAAGFASDVFAWPAATASVAAEADMRSLFTVSRGGGQQIETLPPARPEWLRSYFAQSPNNTATTLTTQITAAKAAKSWLILTFHDVVASSPSSLGILQSEFTTLITNLASSGMEVLTISDVLRRCSLGSGL